MSLVRLGRISSQVSRRLGNARGMSSKWEGRDLHRQLGSGYSESESDPPPRGPQGDDHGTNVEEWFDAGAALESTLPYNDLREHFDSRTVDDHESHARAHDCVDVEEEKRVKFPDFPRGFSNYDHALELTLKKCSSPDDFYRHSEKYRVDYYNGFAYVQAAVGLWMDKTDAEMDRMKNDVLVATLTAAPAEKVCDWWSWKERQLAFKAARVPGAVTTGSHQEDSIEGVLQSQDEGDDAPVEFTVIDTTRLLHLYSKLSFCHPEMLDVLSKSHEFVSSCSAQSLAAVALHFIAVKEGWRVPTSTVHAIQTRGKRLLMDDDPEDNESHAAICWFLDVFEGGDDKCAEYMEKWCESDAFWEPTNGDMKSGSVRHAWAVVDFAVKSGIRINSFEREIIKHGRGWMHREKDWVGSFQLIIKEYVEHFVDKGLEDDIIDAEDGDDNDKQDHELILRDEWEDFNRRMFSEENADEDEDENINDFHDGEGRPNSPA